MLKLQGNISDCLITLIQVMLVKDILSKLLTNIESQRNLKSTDRFLWIPVSTKKRAEFKNC